MYFLRSFFFVFLSTTSFVVWFLPTGVDAATVEPCGTITNGCGNHGKCVLDSTSCGDNCQYRCVCDTGFVGDECTIRVDTCPDTVGPNGARTCLHGGICQRNPASDNNEWMCDCSNAKKGGKMYAGHQCEYPATASCEIGQTESSHAFCTNGGRCRKQVESGQHHPMCICQDGFEGRHCQFVQGTVPAHDAIFTIPPPPPSKSGISGGGIAALVILSLMITMGLAIYIMRPKNGQKAPKVVNIAFPNDLELNTTSSNDDTMDQKQQEQEEGGETNNNEII